MSEPVRLQGVGAGGVPMQVSVFRDKSAARCFGVLGIVGGVCTFLAGVTIVIIKASRGRGKDEVLSYASIILIGVVIGALGVALSATARSKRSVPYLAVSSREMTRITAPAPFFFRTVIKMNIRSLEKRRSQRWRTRLRLLSMTHRRQPPTKLVPTTPIPPMDRAPPADNPKMKVRTFFPHLS